MSIFKYKKDEMRFFYMHPIAAMIAMDMCNWAQLRNLRYQITATVSTEAEDKKISRVSSSHRQGRAFDLSIREWTRNDLVQFEKHFEAKYHKYAAVSAKSLKKNLVVIHNGTAPHIHVQINAVYAKDVELPRRVAKTDIK